MIHELLDFILIIGFIALISITVIYVIVLFYQIALPVLAVYYLLNIYDIPKEDNNGESQSRIEN